MYTFTCTILLHITHAVYLCAYLMVCILHSLINISTYTCQTLPHTLGARPGSHPKSREGTAGGGSIIYTALEMQSNVISDCELSVLIKCLLQAIIKSMQGLTEQMENAKTITGRS